MGNTDFEKLFFILSCMSCSRKVRPVRLRRTFAETDVLLLLMLIHSCAFHSLVQAEAIYWLAD